MEGIIQFGSPVQRRLSKMYSDTKQSLNFVSKAAVDEDEELKKLHRKLRIQKDRLTTWGLRWCDAAEKMPDTASQLTAHDDIDESLSRAGLGDVVGSIMGTIKDILAEAEPLWKASGGINIGLSARAAEKATEAKRPLVQWDRARFEDLLKDLTSSIDTLYDISRMRTGEAQKTKSKKNIELVVRPERTFEKARMDTPQMIDPKRLRTSGGASIVSVNDDGSESLMVEGGKQILYLWDERSKPADQRTPVLVEFASYDSLYSFTGIGPPMTRFEKLFNALQRDEDGAEKADFGSLRLIGYFEESRDSRFALVYELPDRLKAMRQPGFGNSSSPVPYFARLTDLLSHRSLEPPLEVKYRLAYNLATSVFDLHSRGVVHGNLALSNITFFESHAAPLPLQPNTEPVWSLLSDNTTIKETLTDDWVTRVDLKRPYLTSYDLFPEPASSDGSSLRELADITWYRHRFDPRLTARSPFTMESQQLDLYALALLLLEIGLWQSSKEMRHGISTNSIVMDVKDDPASVGKLLAARCGTSYKDAFQACFEAVGSKNRASQTKSRRSDVDLQKVYGTVLSCLEKCCSIEDSEVAGDISDDEDLLPFVPVSESQKETATATPHKKWASSTPKQSQAHTGSVSETRSHFPPNRDWMKPHEVVKNAGNKSLEYERDDDNDVGPKEKPRRFPTTQIMQEHLDTWHKCLMPQINEALRSFYRKHSESVEISLETIGESPQKAKPTILVICTSVGKVKSVLKRRFNYDAATYGLMVCKGKIVRSGARKRRPRRSMFHGGDTFVEPRNIQYQPRPLNGASIGAYAEGQALLPVSFGGMITIDGESFGMSVHHMLDVPSDDEYDYEDEASIPTIGSSEDDSYVLKSPMVPHAPEYGYELSDYDTDTESYLSSDDESVFEPEMEPGDIGGIAPEDCKEGYLITQPAFDDVGNEYFRTTDHMDEYLTKYTVGRLYASSGIRRRICASNFTHEIDWALFRFEADRMPTGNHITGASAYCSATTEYPASCVPFKELAGRKVHAMGRTTGLTGGYIQPALVWVKMKGRQTPAASYTITGGLGVPGDSGAWVMENEQGRACGHVLAWSDKKQVAYFSPMEMMLEDIKETLNIDSIGFPMSKVGSGKSVEEEEPVTVDSSSADMTSGVSISNVDPSDRSYLARSQLKRAMSSPRLKGQTKESVRELDIVSGMEGMCLSSGLVLQSSAI